MRKATLIAVFAAAPLALFGGAGATYLWMTRGQANLAADRSGDAEQDEHDSVAPAHAGENEHDERR